MQNAVPGWSDDPKLFKTKSDDKLDEHNKLEEYKNLRFLRFVPCTRPSIV